jgi:hypothetical protein
MMKVGAGIARARGAIAGRIEFFVRVFVNAPPHLEKAPGSKDGASLRQLRRHDAVEHVYAAMDGFEDIERRADAHQIAWLVFRQKLRGEFAHRFALAFAFAHREPPDRVTVKCHLA